MKKLFSYSVIIKIIFFFVFVGGIIQIFSFPVGLNKFDGYDFLEGVLLSEASLKSGTIVSPTFYYYYLLPFGPSLYFVPFVYLIGPSLLSNQLGMLLFYFIYLFILYYLANSIFIETNNRYLFMSITSLFIFTYIGDNILHHILCYGIGLLCFFGELGSCINYIKNKKTKYIIFLFIFAIYASLNGLSVMAFSTIPIIISLIAMWLCKIDNKIFDNKKRIFSIICLIVFVSIIGLIINKQVSSAATLCLGRDINRFYLAHTDDICNNIINNLLTNVVKIFCYDRYGAFFVSFASIDFFVSFLFMICSIVLFYFSIKKINIKKNISFFIFASNIVVIFISIFMFIFSDHSNERYLFNGFISVYIMIALYIVMNIELINKRYLYIIGLCIFVFILLIKQCGEFYYNNNKKIYYDSLKDILIDSKCKFGFANQSNAVPLHLLSNGELEFGYIDTDNQYDNGKLSLVKETNFYDNYVLENLSENIFVIMNMNNYRNLVKSNLNNIDIIKTINYFDEVILIVNKYNIEKLLIN